MGSFCPNCQSVLIEITLFSGSAPHCTKCEPLPSQAKPVMPETVQIGIDLGYPPAYSKSQIYNQAFNILPIWQSPGDFFPIEVETIYEDGMIGHHIMSAEDWRDAMDSDEGGSRFKGYRLISIGGGRWKNK